MSTLPPYVYIYIYVYICIYIYIYIYICIYVCIVFYETEIIGYVVLAHNFT